MHVSLSVFALAFIVLHVVVLATDSYAGVGSRGALVPMGSGYRPVPVTLGVIALCAGLLAGLTAALAGRVTGRVWWPIHKVAIVVARPRVGARRLGRQRLAPFCSRCTRHGGGRRLRRR